MEESKRGYEEMITGFVRELGYTPMLGVNWSTKRRYELGSYALIKPAAVSEKSGVECGRLSSEIEFVLLKCHVDSDIDLISGMWAKLKCDALEIVAQMERSGYVLECEELEITPLARQISNYDEVAIEVTATVVSNYTMGSGTLSIV